MIDFEAEIQRAHACEPDVQCVVARSFREREGAFRLVHNAYVKAGLADPNPYELRATPHQLLPTTSVFVARCRSEIISTVSLVIDGSMGLPMEGVFPDEVQRLRDRGWRVAEVSCLADRRREMGRALPLFFELTRFMAQFARHHAVDALLIAVHPRHARFYKRYMGFEQFADERRYPMALDKPAVACQLDFARTDRERPRCYDEFFGEMIPDEELTPSPMSVPEQLYFSTFVNDSVLLPCATGY